MKKRKTASLLFLVLLAILAIGYFCFNLYQKEKDLNNKVRELSTKNSELTALVKSEQPKQDTLQTDSKSQKELIINSLKNIDAFQLKMGSTTWANTSLLKILNRELVYQRAFLISQLENTSATSDVVVKRVNLIDTFISNAITQIDYVNNLDLSEVSQAFSSALSDSSDVANRNKQINDTVNIYRTTIFSVKISEDLGLLKDQTGSTKLNVCQQLVKDSKEVEDGVSLLEEGIANLTSSLMSKPWLTPVGKVQARDLFASNLKSASSVIVAKVISKEVNSEYDFSLGCNYFKNTISDLNLENQRLQSVLIELNLIAAKTTEQLSNFCKRVPEEDCKKAIDNVSTNVAIKSSTWPFMNIKLEKRVEDEIVSYIRQKEGLSGNRGTVNNFVREDQNRVNQPTSTQDPTLPLGTNQKVEFK